MSILRSLVLILMISHSGSSYSQSYDSKENDRADSLVLAGSLNEAIQVLEKLIEIEPQNSRAFANIGVLKGMVGDTLKALVFFDKAISIDSNNLNAHKNRAIIYNTQGNYTSALSDMNKTILLGDTTAFNYSYRANIKCALNMYTESLTDFDQAIKINPDYDTAFVMKAKAIVYLKDDFKSAIKILTNYLERNPESDYIRISRAELYIQQKEYSSVIKDMNFLISSTTANKKRNYYIRGMSKHFLGDMQGACEDMEVSRKEGSIEAFNFQTENCMSLNPSSHLKAHILGEEGQKYLARKLNNLAITKLNEAIQLDPTNNVYYYARGMAHYNKLDYEYAQLDFKKSLELQENTAWTLFMLGKCIIKMDEYSEHPDYEGALNYFSRAYLLEKNELQFIYALAALYIDMGNYALGEEYLLRAIKLFPENGELNKVLGQNYLLMNKIDQACIEFKRALELGDMNVMQFLNENCTK